MEIPLRRLKKKSGMERLLELMARTKEGKRQFFDLSWLWIENERPRVGGSIDYNIYIALQQTLMDKSFS